MGACVHYTDSDCGVYEEISLAFFVKKYGQTTWLPYIGTCYDIFSGQTVNHTWKLPVTTRLARDAGLRMRAYGSGAAASASATIRLQSSFVAWTCHTGPFSPTGWPVYLSK